MSAREELKKIQDELGELEMQQEALRELEYPLSLKRHGIIQQLIDEEKPFSGTEWDLKINYSGKVYLSYAGSRQDANMDEIDKWCSNSWHDSFKLEEGVTLYFDDNNMSLGFSDSSQIAEVAKRHNLVVHAADVEERAGTLFQELTNLQKICGQFGYRLPTA